MIREYCDKCGKQMPEAGLVKDPESEVTYLKSVRTEVIVNTGSDKNNMMNYSSDVLCPECARNYTIHVEP